MSDRIPSNHEQSMAERFRREALEERPLFSASLHARICEAVQQEAAPRNEILRPHLARRRIVRWAFATAIAASLLVAALTGRVRRPAADGGVRREPELVQGSSTAAGPQAEELLAAVGLAREITAEFPILVDSTLGAQRWAYLDHDVQLTVEMIAACVPWEIASPATTAAAKNP